MTHHVSVLALSLALAASPHAAASPADDDTNVAPLPDGGRFGAGVHRFSASVIDGGDFVRTADGIEPASVEIRGRDGLVIDGGTFRTAHPVDLTRGVELGRGKSISLYNKTHPEASGAGASRAPRAGYQLYTAAQVSEFFANGDAERIRSAFTSADANDVPPEPLTEMAVLAALGAASSVMRARDQSAWKLTADSGDLVVNDGVLDFNSLNQNLIAARDGKLVWNGGDLSSRGGGGETTLQGTRGIELLGGSISSAGAVNGTVSPIYYDPRQRLDRDRWTLGKYLALVTDGDIDIGSAGTPGPAIRVSDGMVQIMRASKPPGDGATRPPAPSVNLRSGSISLHGEHRSTLLALGADVTTVIGGGTLSVSSSQSLIDTPTESPSMWNMQTVLEDGTINLDNGQLIGADSAIKGGVVNLTGLSAIYSPMGALTISGGAINVDPQSFIGAIKGDSKARSPYPTAQQDMVIDGGTLNFRIVAPEPGEPLVVGTHIGGIFAGDNNPAKKSEPTLTIGKGTRIIVDTGNLLAGSYRIADFASVDDGDGTLAIAAAVPVHDPTGAVIGSLATDGSLALQLN
ncbi:hypothetical protein [Lysobacter sp. H23M47]|uniref:hypothetical protein n=1 Tax=Lysobacter sp. H23M47 TaxID=2781024 RepID=UPI001D168E08|nr:hypothetical protein [Lysobacter sp. H23M47]